MKESGQHVLVLYLAPSCIEIAIVAITHSFSHNHHHHHHHHSWKHQHAPTVKQTLQVPVVGV